MRIKYWKIKICRTWSTDGQMNFVHLIKALNTEHIDCNRQKWFLVLT